MSDLDVWELRQKGLPYKEIAEKLNISEKRARWAVHDVKKEMEATADALVNPVDVIAANKMFGLSARGQSSEPIFSKDDVLVYPQVVSSIGTKPIKHMFIPDTQCAPGDNLEHLRWAGEYAAEQEPDVIIHAGDHWHMDSLSSYEKPGSKFFEGKRYVDDIAAGNKGLELFEEGLTRRSRAEYKPRKVLLRGNHEERILRAIETEPRMEGAIGFHHFNDVQLGWEIHDFLELVEIDGVSYSHYFYLRNSGRAYTGSMDSRLKNVGHSFSQGHQQGLMWGRRELGNGQAHCGLVAGSFYQKNENYRGPQANNEWRGIIMKHEVRNGQYDPMMVSISYLQRTFGKH